MLSILQNPIVNGISYILAGIFSILIGHGYLPFKPKDPVVWKRRFVPILKFLGLFLISCGILMIILYLY